VIRLVAWPARSSDRVVVHALADAIAALPLATFQVALAIHGDPTGQGVTALVRFLRQGDVLLVDGRGDEPC
jgi:hypothetical protein